MGSRGIDVDTSLAVKTEEKKGYYLKVDRSRKVTRVCRYDSRNAPVKRVNLMVQRSEQKIARLEKQGDLGHR